MQRSEQTILLFDAEEVTKALFGAHGPPPGMGVVSVMPTLRSDGALSYLTVTLDPGPYYVPGD